MIFKDVQSILKYKDLSEQKEYKSSSIGEELFVKGKFSKKDGRFEKKKDKVLQYSYGGNVPAIRCYQCKKESNTRKVSSDRLNNHGGKYNGNAAIVQDAYQSYDVPVISSSDSS